MPAKKNNHSRLLLACFELADVLVSAVIAIAVIFTFGARFAGVIGSSMTPTLHNNDWLAVTAFLITPAHGDIVIISPRVNGFHEPLVKRVVAVAGDVVDIKEDKLWVNGIAQEEPYLSLGMPTRPALWESTTYPRTVPEGCVFVMGDNRTGSTDSRVSAVGFIRVDDILGKVLVRINPFYARDPQFRFTFMVK